MFSVFVLLVIFDNLLFVSDSLCLAVNVFNQIVDVSKLFLLFLKKWFIAEFDIFVGFFCSAGFFFRAVTRDKFRSYWFLP
jgi:hypothetical protein